MAASHNSLILRFKPFLYALSACLSLVGFTIVGVEALYNKNLRAPVERVEALQADFLETYLDDVDFLERTPLGGTAGPASEGPEPAARAPESTLFKDAGPTLNKMVYWNPPSDIGAKAPLVEPKSREFLMRNQDDWIKSRSFLERGSIKADISFFKEVSRFEYWDIEKNSPIEHLISRGEFVLPSKIPLPEALDLLTAVKVRLMRGSIDGNPVAALKDVRKFAMLLLTTENYQLVMVGLATIDLERRAYRDYVDRDWLDADTWQPIDRNTSTRAARAYAATAGYLRALTRESVFQKIFASGRTPPGFCAAINEQLPLEFVYRNQLTGWWPFERGYRAGFNRLDEALELAKKHCRLAFLTCLQKNGSIGGVEPSGPWPLTHFPYFRGLFALREWATMPTRLDGYQRR